MFTYPIVYFPMTPGSGGGGSSYVLPTASANELGGIYADPVQPGDGYTGGVRIDANGKLCVLPNTDTQADWNETDTTDPAYIANKPTIPSLVQSDWDETDTTDPSYIANKPTIPDISGKRDLPATVSVHVIDPNTAIGNVAANTVYTCDAALTYLNITAVETSDLESQVWFTAGSSNPTVLLPSTVPVIGSATFQAGKGYVISFQNGVAVIGEYSVS